LNGPQDLGGKRGLGAVPDPGADPEHVFGSDWERRVFALSFCSWVASGVHVDESRSLQASLPYDRYYGSSYYERWLHSLERLIVAKGVASEAELEAGRALPDGGAASPLVEPSGLEAAVGELADGGIRRFRDAPGQPAHVAGERVRVRRINPRTYDRLPSYVKGRLGTIDEHYGAFAHPADIAAGRTDAPGVRCYRVRFAATELWGESAERSGDSLCIDLFENHLESP
jgi:nitrile hydratase subunit beta